MARRYADSRPYFHPLVINKIESSLKLREPVPTALDIAYGTGRSSVALKEIASQIIGTDASSERCWYKRHRMPASATSRPC